MAGSSSHIPNVTVSTLLEALSTPQAGFGTVTLLVDQNSGNNLGASPYPRYVDLADVDEAQALRDAGYITASVMEACTVAFSQAPIPSKFRLCRVDTAGAETYTNALTDLLATDVADDVCVICMDSRTAAVQVLLESTVEARGGDILLLIQSGDADWITSGLPSGYSTSAGRKFSGVVYHDISGEWLDVATAVRACAFDADATSAPWEGVVAEVANYSARLTSTQRGYAIANYAGVLGTWGSSDYWIDNVVTHEGRPFYEVLSAALFRARCKEGIQTLHQREHGFGRKVRVAASGQKQTQAVIEGVVRAMASAGHFEPGQTEVLPLAITDADRSARKLRFQVRAQVGISARLFDVDAYFTTSPIITEVAA